MKQFVAVFGPAASLHQEAAGAGGHIFRGNVFLQESASLSSLSSILQRQRTELRKPVPEVLVLGRSNVGKSSLINALVDMKVARTAKTPGRTQRLFFYNVDNRLMLVDPPGYGFAEAPGETTKQWVKMTQEYLSHSPRLSVVLCLINSAHGVKVSDQFAFDFLESCQRPFLVALTKADKARNLPVALKTVYDATKRYTQRVDAVYAVSAKETLGFEALRAALIYHTKQPTN